MNKQDWFISSVIAVLVAAVTVVLMIPSIGWAGQEALVTVPELPSTSLKIPSINAEVSASPNNSEPGKEVKVTLEVRSGEGGAKVAEVPVLVTVMSRTGDPMSRSDLPVRKTVAQVLASVSVDSGGSGTTTVELPLLWGEKPTVPEVNTSNNNNQQLIQQNSREVTTYQIVLSSELSGEVNPEVFLLSLNTPVYKNMATVQTNIKPIQNVRPLVKPTELRQQ